MKAASTVIRGNVTALVASPLLLLTSAIAVRAQDAVQSPAPDASIARSPENEAPVPDTLAPDAPVAEAPAESPAADAPSTMPPSADAAPADGAVADVPPAPPRPAAPDITVLESQLLAVLTDPGGIDTVTPTTSIPYVVGRSCYTWTVKFQPVEGDLTLTEELTLPGPARNWGPETGKSEINPQGSDAITERHFDAATGVATAGWCVAKDDPVGSYRYIIRQGEREVARFDFTVGDLL